MEDQKIVELYWQRSEDAIAETQAKYGKYCFHIANNILASVEDAEECVNDTYLKAWRAIPPERPSLLKSFLAKITRNTALDRYAYRRAEKRTAATEAALLELEECIPSADGDASDELALRTAINGFLAALPRQLRILFVRRYFYVTPIKELAHALSMTESNVKVTLHRLRAAFKEHLEKEGIIL